VSEGTAQTCALPLFCDRDLEINLLTLKLKDDLGILKKFTLKILAQGFQILQLGLEKSEIRCRDLSLGPMTLKLNRDFDILKMYL